jgi:hypothetical protein
MHQQQHHLHLYLQLFLVFVVVLLLLQQHHLLEHHCHLLQYLELPHLLNASCPNIGSLRLRRQTNTCDSHSWQVSASKSLSCY